MKNKNTLIISASAASLFLLHVLADDNSNETRDRYRQVEHRGTNQLSSYGATKASDILGARVVNYQDEKLGKVEDAAIDLESGRIVQVILSTGGFAGVGDTHLAVPPSALHADAAQKVIHLDASKDKFTSAPKFDMSKWADYNEKERLENVYRYYGQGETREFIEDGGTTRARKEANADDLPSRNRADGRDRSKDQIRHRDALSVIPASRLGQVQRLSKLVGMQVVNLQEEKLGKVDNLLLDLGSGRVVLVVVSTGGFLGIGDELSAVPPTAFRFSEGRDALRLDANKETLGSAPHFKSHQWPDLDQPGYAAGVYDSFRVEPYFSTKSVKAADNTARNVRDRNSGTTTPLDQGNSQVDLDVTARIRKAILADKGMSVNAQNVKIITANGWITLRGPVATEEEKRKISRIAQSLAREENVDDQLEVK